MGKTQYKVKQANRKFKHDLKRRRKAFAEKKRTALAVERAGRLKNERKKSARAYVGALGDDLV